MAVATIARINLPADEIIKHFKNLTERDGGQSFGAPSKLVQSRGLKSLTGKVYSATRYLNRLKIDLATEVRR